PRRARARSGACATSLCNAAGAGDSIFEKTMRTPIMASLGTAVVLVGCGDNHSVPSVPPRIIEGGGIGDGPIDGVANVYVIDDTTREPVAGATVQVGTVTGSTDDTGLFVAEGVEGPQTVVVTSDAEYINENNRRY